ncbi:cytochrome C biogenesis protein [Nibricoccus aquaticus]|uniref:Cytochrome C biogenesis protein n=1 Tax=Nibricoccus aquaticus TaxID=2576891 RepID=A0A290Q9M5_9BACT|nr:cytochrome c biogenesis protein CcsA [Nibricoccus aquaticus]ATC65224.1 cytochrome C biogenesis protein [Nibricoccus aquaticus]
MPALTDRTWLWFAAVFYFAGLVLGTISVLRQRRHSRAAMYFLISVGFFIQTFGLYLRGLAVKGCPIGNHFEIFQFTAWSATSLYLVIGATFRLSLLGYFTSCLAATLTLLSLAIPSFDAVRRVGTFPNAWIEFHAALAIFSYGVFALLALTATMYLLQIYSLKNHRLRGLFSFLPSILDLDHINLRLLKAGVFLMTASLAVGSVYWLRDTSSVNAPKLIITLAIWLAYAVTFGLRILNRLLAKRLAWTCILLFAAALISLPIVNSSRKPLTPEPAPHTVPRSSESAPATSALLTTRYSLLATSAQ